MNCPICEQALGKKPIVFQKKYFSRLPQDQAICKGCYESWPEGDVYNMLAPEEGDNEEIKRDYIALHKQKLIRKYVKMRKWVSVYIILYVGFMVYGMIMTHRIKIDILFWILIGCFISADVIARRFLDVQKTDAVGRRLFETGGGVPADVGYVTPQTRQLRKRYTIVRLVGLLSLSVYILRDTIQRTPTGGININFNILLWILIAALLSADWNIRRLFEIGAMTPEEKEMLAEKVKLARCGICDAVQPFEVHSLRGGYFPEGVVLLKDYYPDLPHDTYVCEKCRAKHPSNQAIYDYLTQTASRRGKPES